jgi:hypothetical protein
VPEIDDDKPLTELDSVPGDIIEHADGNRFLALPNGALAFVGNKDSRLDGLLTKRGTTYCKILRRVQLPEYRLANAPICMEDDWDAIRGVTRFRAPLPHGCSCTHDILEQVLKCKVHRVKAVAATYVSNTVTVTGDGTILNDVFDVLMATLPPEDTSFDDDIDEL